MSLINGLTFFKVLDTVLVENTSDPGFTESLLIDASSITPTVLKDNFFRGQTFEYSYVSPGLKTLRLQSSKVIEGQTYTSIKNETFEVGYAPNETIEFTKRADQQSSYEENYVVAGVTFNVSVKINGDQGTPPLYFIWNVPGGITFDQPSVLPQTILYNTIGTRFIGLTVSNKFGTKYSQISIVSINNPILGITSNFPFDTIPLETEVEFYPNYIQYGGHLEEDISYFWLIDGVSYGTSNLFYTFNNEGIIGVTLHYQSNILAGLSGSAFKQYNVTATSKIFYVSDSIGNDSWLGVTSGVSGIFGPVKTLNKAAELVRSFTENRDVEVRIAGGIYRFTEQSFYLTGPDSIETRTVTYKPHNNQQVFISGGYSLSPSWFSPVTAGNSAIYSRLKPNAQGQVYEADFSSLSMPIGASFPLMWNGMGGNLERGLPDYPELYFEKQRMILARWPNKNSIFQHDLDFEICAQIGLNINSGSSVGIRPGNTMGVFGYTSDYDSTIATWKVTGPSEYDGIWLQGCWKYDWRNEVFKVHEIDKVNRRITINSQLSGYGIGRQRPCGHPTTEPKPGLQGDGSGQPVDSNPSPRRWYAFNLLEELDFPGEYYIDRPNKKLYFWPPTPITATSSIALGSINLSGRNSWVPGTPTWPVSTNGVDHPWTGRVKENIIDVNQSVFKLYKVKNLRIENLQFIECPSSGIELLLCKDVYIKGCTIDFPRGSGIVVRGGRNVTIDGCSVNYPGLNGVILSGGDRRRLIPGNNELKNSRIIGAGQHSLSTSQSCILTGVGNKIRKNVIHDSIGSLLVFYGNDHIIEYNNFDKGCYGTEDNGAIYTNYNPTDNNITIKYNLFNNIRSNLPGFPCPIPTPGYYADGSLHGTHCIYFDYQSWGKHIIQNNIFNKCGETAAYPKGCITIHTYDDPLKNNIFVDCPSPGLHWAYYYIIDGKNFNNRVAYSKQGLNATIYDEWNEDGNPNTYRMWRMNQYTAPYANYGSGFASYWAGVTGVNNAVDVTSPEWQAKYPNFAINVGYPASTPPGISSYFQRISYGETLQGNTWIVLTPISMSVVDSLNQYKSLNYLIYDNIVINSLNMGGTLCKNNSTGQFIPGSTLCYQCGPFITAQGAGNNFWPITPGSYGTGKIVVGNNFTGGTQFYNIFEDRNNLNFNLTPAGLSLIRGVIPNFELIPFDEIPVL